MNKERLLAILDRNPIEPIPKFMDPVQIDYINRYKSARNGDMPIFKRKGSYNGSSR
jgi:hypothetical protein